MAELEFTMGADPEFLCVDGRSLVESAAYTNTQNELGCDANGVLFEVRPGPSTDPIEIVGNIHDIMARWMTANKDFVKFKWLAGSHYADQNIGGHIHFDIKPAKIPTAEIANVLDNYVGAITMLLESRNQGLRRRQGQYGRMGDTRPQTWGFEYRTCASWLTSPYVAAGVLSLAKAVVWEFANNPNFEPRRIITQEDFHTMNTDKIYAVFPDLWKDIASMKMYQQYKVYIDLLYFLVKKRYTWFPSTNMKEAWGLVDMTEAYVDKMKMSVIWERFNQEVSQNGFAITVPVERPRHYR
jgi:hypothetical protein